MIDRVDDLEDVDEAPPEAPPSPVPPLTVPRPPRRVHVARAELALSRPGVVPLAELKHDALQAFAGSFNQLRRDLGDDAQVRVSLLPLLPGAGRRIRRAMLDQAGRNGGAFRRMLSADRGRRGGPMDAGERLERTYEQTGLAEKLGRDAPPAFAYLQVLLRAQSEVPGRARNILKAIVDNFRQADGQNSFRVVGLRIPGIAFLGSDELPWLRWWFDRRWRTGLFAPVRRPLLPWPPSPSLVNADELWWMLKPPTKHCRATNVMRSGGEIPPPPRSLPDYTGQADVLPLGMVRDEEERMAGIPMDGLFFLYLPGRARWGKSELALNMFLHVALRARLGALFIDPHEQAIERAKAYLTNEADRVVEINLAGRRPQPGWNLLSMEGLAEEDLPEKLQAFSNALAAVQGWSSKTNSRAFNLAMQAAAVLLELNRQLCQARRADIQATFFQIPSLLANDEWRAAVLDRLPPAARAWWMNEFPDLKKEATPPVTHLIHMMRQLPAARTLLGQSRSTFDTRRAMDERQIVLVCPGASQNAESRLLTNLLVYDLVRAAHSRGATKGLPDFWLWLDELQGYDGALSGSVADVLEQTAKFGLRAGAMNQDPDALTDRTLAALMTNALTVATAVKLEAASKLAKKWQNGPSGATLARLPKYHYIADLEIDRSDPFLVRGLPIEETFGEYAHPDDVGALEARVTERTGRRSPAEVKAHLDELDGLIFDWLGDNPPPEVPGARRPRGGPGGVEVARPRVGLDG